MLEEQNGTFFRNYGVSVPSLLYLEQSRLRVFCLSEIHSGGITSAQNDKAPA